MPITCRTFADWLEPGPDLLDRPGPLMQLPGYASSLKVGDTTGLTAAIPTVFAEPDLNEWRNELSSLEWKTIGPLWTALGRAILQRDPWFSFVKHSAYIDNSGRFTAKFKGATWYPRYVAELAWRMEEEIAFYRGHLERVALVAKQSSWLSLEEDPLTEPDIAPSGADPIVEGELWIPRISWKRVFDIGVKIWNTERKIVLWTPQGWAQNIAWEVGVHGAKWAHKQYRQHQRAEERKNRQQKHQKKYSKAEDALDLVGLTLFDDDQEIADQLGSVGNTQLYGFFPLAATDYAGLWAAQAKPSDSQYSWRIPNVAYSQDGVYL